MPSEVTIGKGKLAGKGLYATRNFKKGELVTTWNLKELTQAEFDSLAKGEHMFVHSFRGKMYLFPEPARYTNHSANPNTVADFNKMCDFAARLIKKGEMITTNATEEIKFELETFLQAYEKAANGRDFNNVEPLISKNAVFEFTNGTFKGIDAIRTAFENTYNKIQNEAYSITDVEWVEISYSNAECKYRFRSDGIVNGKRQMYEGLGHNQLKRMDGNWRIVHEQLRKAD